MIFFPKTALSLFLCDFFTFYFHSHRYLGGNDVGQDLAHNQMGKLKE